MRRVLATAVLLVLISSSAWGATVVTSKVLTLRCHPRLVLFVRTGYVNISAVCLW